MRPFHDATIPFTCAKQAQTAAATRINSDGQPEFLPREFPSNEQVATIVNDVFGARQKAQVTKIIGDGDCFWWALTRALNGDYGGPSDPLIGFPKQPGEHDGIDYNATQGKERIKARIIQHWCQNLKPMFEAEYSMLQTAIDPFEWPWGLNAMMEMDEGVKNNGYYAGVVWALVAADLYKMPIWTVSKSRVRIFYPDFIEPNNAFYAKNEPIVLVFSGSGAGAHFDVVTGYTTQPQWPSASILSFNSYPKFLNPKMAQGGLIKYPRGTYTEFPLKIKSPGNLLSQDVP